METVPGGGSDTSSGDRQDVQSSGGTQTEIIIVHNGGWGGVSNVLSEGKSVPCASVQ